MPYHQSQQTLNNITYPVRVYETANQAKPTALILHGAGNASMASVHVLAEALAALGRSTITFDFIGHGEHKALQPQSSLALRRQQAEQVIEAYFSNGPDLLIGFSMSGHTVVEIGCAGRWEIETLLLFAPAMYHPDATTVAFGEGFSDIIRQPNSWQHSQVPQLLQNYTGRFYVVIGEEDDVIPKPIPEIMVSSATSAQEKALKIVPGMEHTIGKWMRENPLAGSEWVTSVLKELQIIGENDP